MMSFTKEQQDQHQQDQEMIQRIIMQCWVDESFKSKLMTNPIGTIEKFTGKKSNLPQGHEIIVVDQSDESNVYLNIPNKPNLDEMQLTDEQLEMIHGGALPLVVLYLGYIGSGMTAGYVVGHLFN